MSAFEPSGTLIRLQELIHVSVKPGSYMLPTVNWGLFSN